MATHFLRKHLHVVLSVIGLGLLILSLLVLSQASQTAVGPRSWHQYLLMLNGFGVVGLLIVIGYHTRRLLTSLRHRQTGSRLHARVFTMFGLLALLPLALVFFFSVQFIHRGVDGYFNADVEQALDSALVLSRVSLDRSLQRHWHDVRAMARSLQRQNITSDVLQALRAQYQADVVMVLEKPYRIIALSAQAQMGPNWPQPSPMLWRAGARSVAQVELVAEQDAAFRAHTIAPLTQASKPLWVFAIFDLDANLQALASEVQTGIGEYHQAFYARRFLQTHFILTLSLALLVSFLAALWGALVFARRLTQPIESLALGTQAVADGNFSLRLPAGARDELGMLVESFNAMTSQLEQAQVRDQQHQSELERARSRLAVMLANLSSGVLVVNEDLKLTMANSAASSILRANLHGLTNAVSLPSLASRHPGVMAFVQSHQDQADASLPWRAEIDFVDESATCHLVCTSTPLPTPPGESKRWVVVIDDITHMRHAQHQAAWGEVARQLAHEIKNPLTPIQLAAERLEQHYQAKLPAADLVLMQQSTATIVQQVLAMKDLVNAFGDYAGERDMHWQLTDLGGLITDTLGLYETDVSAGIKLNIESGIAPVYVDPVRWRQILHNLIKNAKEATASVADARVAVGLSLIPATDQTIAHVELSVDDNGEGFSMSAQDVFAPYVTTKAKGTGLGLAIVKKLTEEHDGSVTAGTSALGGARLACRFAYRTANTQPKVA